MPRRPDPDSPSARRAERRARTGALDAVIGDGRLVTRPLVPSPDAPAAPRTLVIACGALMAELQAVASLNNWRHLDVTGVPAGYHNRPEKIAPAVAAKIRAARETYANILVAYGDCGTAGALDAVLSEEGVTRIEGAHCYAFFTGLSRFDEIQDAEIGTFYLTDFLARHFETLVMAGLDLKRHPDLLKAYFGNYTRLVHLVQIPDAATAKAARKAAEHLGLPLVTVETGLEGLKKFIAQQRVEINS